MVDNKKTIRNATFLFIVCILVVTLFALAPFIENQYSGRVFYVTFDMGEGIANNVMVGEKELVTKPEDPVRDGYKFIGWYYKGREYDFSVYVTKDMTLKALWEQEEVAEDTEDTKDKEENKTHVIVTFDVDGGSLIENQKVKIGGTASIPVSPTREGYTFVEWQVDGKKFDFGTLLEEDITIVAIWKEN